jgi:hypothetical protein
MPSHASERRDPAQMPPDHDRKPLPPRQEAAADPVRLARPLDFAEAMRRVEAEVYDGE